MLADEDNERTLTLAAAVVGVTVVDVIAALRLARWEPTTSRCARSPIPRS